MSIDPNRPICGPDATKAQKQGEKAPGDPKKQQDCEPKRAHRRTWDKDHIKLHWDTKGEARFVPLEPGEEKSATQKLGNDAWEKIAHVANKVKMALAMPELETDREVVAYVTGIDKINSADGDMTMDIVPVGKDKEILDYRGRHRAMVPDMDKKGKYIPDQGVAATRGGVLHTEAHQDQLDADPKLAEQFDELQELLAAGKTPLVRMHGQLTFDPFHDGWMEIHPIKGIEILDTNSVPPAATAPGPTSGLWAERKAQFSASPLTSGFTFRTGATVGNGGGIMFQGGKDLLYFGTKPGYVPDKDGNIADFKGGFRGTLTGQGAGILAGGGNQGRLGGALGFEYYTWGNAIRAEAIGGEAFASDACRQGPYVGGRLSYTLNEGPGDSRIGAFVQVDKTIASQGPVMGSFGLSLGY